MLDFKIAENFVLTNSAIAVVFEIEPVDLLLLPEQEQELFSVNLQRTLNSLTGDQIQIIMRTRRAVPDDFERHFRDITKQEVVIKSSKAKDLHSRLLSGYVKELSVLLENNIIPVKEYYLVIRQEVATSKPKSLEEGIKKLDRLVQRITGSLLRARIKTRHVTNSDVTQKDGKEKINDHKRLEKLIRSFARP